MDQPEIVQADLAGEDVVARVDLGGEDELYVTPTRTLCYRAEGLLSDESVEKYAHGAERISVSEGRRKSKITFDYGLDGEGTLTLPSSRLDHALRPIVEGVLGQNGVLDDDEVVERVFRFGELTVVVASDRVVRHIGSAVWDQEFQSYHYGDVTDLKFEDGSVNTSVVLTVDGQQERFKTPNDEARAVRSTLESTLLSYWGVGSIEEFRDAVAPDDSSGGDAADESEDVGFGDGPDPLFADPAEPEDLPENATRTADDEATDSQAGETPSRADATAGGEPAVGGTADPSGTESSETVADAGRHGDRPPEWDAESDSTTGRASEEPRGQDDAGTGGRVADDSGIHADQTEPRGSGFEGSGSEAAPTDEQLREEIAGMREAVERQNEELAAQRDLLEQLIEELRRGR